jgi:predicted nucleotidyltransferase
MENNLEKSILATIAYFDIFDYPLTIVELWKWLYQSGAEEKKNNLSEILDILENNVKINSLVGSRRGFYFLRGREAIVELRQARYNLAEKKFKRALRVGFFLKRLPGIKMIAVCNNLAWSNAGEESDIDLFVVTEKGKIWTTRFWAAGLLKIFGLRPNEKRTKDKICLSFFADEENLNLEKISLGRPDIYLIYWIAQIAPIYDPGGIYQKFLEANSWIKKYLPNYLGVEPGRQRLLGRQKLALNFLGWGENFFHRIQLRAMPTKLKEMANRDSRVIVNDSMLKFHANDRREEYRDKWIKQISKLTV